MKKIKPILIIIYISFASCEISNEIYSSINILNNILKQKNYPQQNNDNYIYSKRNSETINIMAVGDIMVHKPQLTAQYNSKTDTYDFTNNFMYVKKYIYFSDLALCNLETTLAGKDCTYSGYPAFNSPDELVDALKDCGFDVITTINNHTADKKSRGITRTLDIITEKGLTASGTKKNSSDNNYIIEYVKGIKIGILSYSYGEFVNGEKRLNSIPVPKELSDKVNIFDYRDLKGTISILNNDIEKLKKEKPDVIIFVVHWGEEYSITPNNFQIKLAQKMCNLGVDIIFGSHPHVIQPIEILKSQIDTTHKTVVCYSLGNFLSNQRRKLISNNSYTEDGLIVNVRLKKENDKITIDEVSYIPTWVNKYIKKGKNTYEIIPIIEEDLNNIKNLPPNDIENSLKNTTSIITSKEVKLYKK